MTKVGGVSIQNIYEGSLYKRKTREKEESIRFIAAWVAANFRFLEKTILEEFAEKYNLILTLIECMKGDILRRRESGR